MSSLKMTFSLASLVLIFALAFVRDLRWQQDGGPTVALRLGKVLERWYSSGYTKRRELILK